MTLREVARTVLTIAGLAPVCAVLWFAFVTAPFLEAWSRPRIWMLGLAGAIVVGAACRFVSDSAFAVAAASSGGVVLGHTFAQWELIHTSVPAWRAFRAAPTQALPYVLVVWATLLASWACMHILVRATGKPVTTPD
jgi:hypothetical protein